MVANPSTNLFYPYEDVKNLPQLNLSFLVDLDDVIGKP